MPIPRRQRQWEIYRANLGQGADVFVLVISSNETNEILGTEVIACEVVLESARALPQSPITVKAKPGETGLDEPAVLSAATIASIPRNCLVDLVGSLAPVGLRLSVDKAVQILLGNEPWP